ncbi:hypothetical protein OK414_03650 [Priestia sp. JV24]|uniref:hypothetical protein n=1 Tax=Priestia TaxID=2800373 RepID=UPI0021D65253|nr:MULTISPECIES: hypothetical protein [Priestia]MCU7711132.1 hypothetical protein [Priestia megaterium]MCW1044141.1 hypothetical protein [Priestia sp. JV24]
MTQLLEMNNVIEEVELQEKLYSVRKNWNVLNPYLHDKNVQAVLNQAMSEFCEGNPNGRMWESGDAPWEYTTSDYWCNHIGDATQNNEKFQKEENELFEKLYDSYYDTNDEDDLWFEMWNTKEHCELINKYYDIYSPKKGTIEWYQFVHGCHWINRFTAALISKALNVEVDVWKTDTHTIATFIKDDVIYYADILNEWESLQKLYDFMGEEIDFYSVFDEIE